MSDARDLRVLVPQRLDALARSMDSIISGMWLELSRACDVVLWGPGLFGYEPIPLDVAAERADVDLVLLPDLHHTIPGLWADVWQGLSEVRCPVVAFMSDPGVHVAARRALLRAARPVAMLAMAAPDVYRQYQGVLDDAGAEIVTVPLGVDAALCYPPHAGAERDIDILVSGAEHPAAYPVRSAVKRVARSLGREFTVLDLGHPGYWQLTPDREPTQRGQPLMARYLRRSRLAVTGTTYGIVSQKYFEAAACGAVGVGDLPEGPEADPFRGAMLEIGPQDDDDAIAELLTELLTDPGREQRLRQAGTAAIAGCSLRDRAEQTVAELARLVPPKPSHRPRPFPTPPFPLALCAAPEPERVPEPRCDFRDVWDGAEGRSRTRAAERALADSDADIVVVALDPDAALPADAHYLAEQLRIVRDGVVMRAARATTVAEPAAAGWTTVAAWRTDLLSALAGRRGRAGLEAAVLALATERGAMVLGGPGFDDPAAALCRLLALAESPLAVAPALLESARDAALRAVDEQRVRTALELRGWAQGTLGRRFHLEPLGDGDSPSLPQDPELPDDVPPDATFAVFDPGDPTTADRIASHAAGGAGASVAIGVPIRCGLSVADAADRLMDDLHTRRVDTEHGADLALLSRPLFDAELAWLASRRAPAPSLARA